MWLLALALLLATGKGQRQDEFDPLGSSTRSPWNPQFDDRDQTQAYNPASRNNVIFKEA